MAEISHGLVLGIISATHPQYVFLAENNSILIEKKLVRTRMTGNRIIPSVRSCLDEIGCGIQSVDTFLALSGPGSMTGIRVGLAPVRAWAYTSGKSVVTLDTLSVLAEGFERPTLALMSAGQVNWWIQAFSGSISDTPRLVDRSKLYDYDKIDWNWVTPSRIEPKHAKKITQSPTPTQVLSSMNSAPATNWVKARPRYLFELSKNG